LEENGGPAQSVGVLPGTDVAVNVDLNALVAYHTAILGTTGSGKTTLLHNIIPRLAAQGIKVLIIDSFDEFNFGTKEITISSPKVAHAYSTFLKSSPFGKLFDQLEGKDTDKEDAKEVLEKWDKESVFVSIEDVKTKRHSLGRSRKDGLLKKILDEFTQQWFPREHLLKIQEDEDVDCLAILAQWYAHSEPWDNPTVVIKLHQLSIDERRWVVGLIAEKLFSLSQEEGLAPFLDDSGDPQARTCIIVEEAHIYAPERAFSIGVDDTARRYCERKLRNLMLHARKYGLGAIVASQRSAFIDKGVLSQCNTLFSLKTVSANDKKVFNDFMDSDWANLTTHLGTPPDSPQSILVGKASTGSVPLLIEFEFSPEAR
jgi:energy-coupling factor transporter ATP-binding protein EcfA2